MAKKLAKAQTEGPVTKSRTVTKGQNLYRVVNGKLINTKGEEITPTRELIQKLKKYDEKNKIDDLVDYSDENVKEFTDELAKENNQKVLEDKINETIEELNSNSTLNDEVNKRIEVINQAIRDIKSKVNRLSNIIKKSQYKNRITYKQYFYTTNK